MEKKYHDGPYLRLSLDRDSTKASHDVTLLTVNVGSDGLMSEILLQVKTIIETLRRATYPEEM